MIRDWFPVFLISGIIGLGISFVGVVLTFEDLNNNHSPNLGLIVIFIGMLCVIFAAYILWHKPVYQEDIDRQSQNEVKHD